MKRILPYVLISVLFHATLLYIGVRKSEEPVIKKEKKDVVQISLINLPPKEKPEIRKQIVSLPEHNNQEPIESAHLGEENNSVAEETIAREAGSPTESVDGTGEAGGDVPQTDPSGEGINLFPQDAISGVARDLSGDGGKSNSSGDYVEGVKEGEAAALNVVEFKFASFFNRVKKDISNQWKPLPILYRRDPEGRLLNQERKTLLYIILDDQGNILNISLYKSSGVDFLDEEAVRAVLACQQFPNPPKGLIKNGRVEFFFGFQVLRGGGFLLW